MILFRVDSGKIIGLGHIMRCINFANYILENYYFKSIFISKKHEGYFSINDYETYYMQSDTISNDISTWLGGTISNEIEFITPIILKNKIKILIIDHYSIDYNYETILKKYFPNLKIFIIDDLFRKHLCDFYLSQNYYSSYNLNLINKNTQCFLGPTYSIISNDLKQNLIEKKNTRKNILICFGGSDTNNTTEKIIKLLMTSEKFCKYSFNIVVGKCYPNLDSLMKTIEKFDNIKYYYNISQRKMGEIILENDICIGAGGMSLYERMYLGIGNIVITIADNQKQTAIDLNNKYIIYLSHYNEVDCIKINMIYDYIENLDDKLIENSKKLVSGNGLKYICEKMFNN